MVQNQTSAFAKHPTPVLNTAQFRSIFNGTSLPLDEQGLLRPVETVLFPGTKMQILEYLPDYIVRVKIPQDYPYGENLFVDSRFLMPAEQNAPERTLKMPAAKTILSRLRAMVGARYIWGGNTTGVPLLLQLYPPTLPPEQLDPATREIWALQGVDCSGLIYLATDGCTPRNTSQFVHLGTAVDALSSLQPLDALVWKGHVIFVLDAQHCIESRAGFGVIITNLRQRLAEILKEREFALKWGDSEKPHFVIRRWSCAAHQ
jgi:hypothetical protein